MRSLHIVQKKRSLSISYIRCLCVSNGTNTYDDSKEKSEAKEKRNIETRRADTKVDRIKKEIVFGEFERWLQKQSKNNIQQ